ncbi:MAG: ABC-type transport auxiliary lipoprotein family protein [Bacteroidota bacterium]|nr:ABC-type transport auxiliary lipoprotein family protein [Candidatus Kapabacteria bacterium]MDW8220538.1 ABC-type transport auxiliary lipoprotein family protein [Bacteroidota bacterium]
MRILLLIVMLGGASVSACISLRSEYPKTTYYRLENHSVPKSARTVSEDLLVRPFTIDSEFATDRILVMTSATEVQPLMYHRWVSEPDDLITAYVTRYMQQSGFFLGGVVTPASSLLPSLLLEGHIGECIAVQSTQEGNVVRLRIHCTVQRRNAADRVEVLLQKVYTQIVRRESDAASSIALAMSAAVHALSEALLADIQAVLVR